MVFVALVVVLVIVILVLLKWKGILSWGPSAQERGQQGEDAVRNVIGGTVENEQYVIDNLILEDKGKTSQIDHIVINPRGVYVIETKNYSGDIYGSETQREWTQVLAGGNVRNKLYNPLKQNATHVYRIKKIIGQTPVRSLVVFVQNNTIHIDARNVIPLCLLKGVLAEGEDVLTVEEMKTLYEKLLLSRANVSEVEHVQKVLEQQKDLELGICPRCGGNLVLREGKYGEFLGCSNYPKCRFIKKE